MLSQQHCVCNQDVSLVCYHSNIVYVIKVSLVGALVASTNTLPVFACPSYDVTNLRFALINVCNQDDSLVCNHNNIVYVIKVALVGALVQAPTLCLSKYAHHMT